MATSLVAEPLGLDLGPAVVSAGFRVADYDAIVLELGVFAVEGIPTRAVAKRRAEFLAGRWAARQALGLLGVDGTPGRNEDGSPRWPAHVSGSITHGAERALCAVARATEVRSLGIDAERLMTETTEEALMARICDEQERDVLARGLPRPAHHRVTCAFSAKESLYKCLYPLVGQFKDFNAARVVAADSDAQASFVRGELTLELSVDWSPEFRAGSRFQARFLTSDRHVESAVVLRA